MELKFEAQTWELYEREIRNMILSEGEVAWTRIGVNARLRDTYEELRPYLEALRTFGVQKGYRAALDRYKPPDADPDVEEEIAVEQGKTRDAIDAHRAKLSELEEKFKPLIRRVHMLRALRAGLPPAEPEDLPEPP